MANEQETAQAFVADVIANCAVFREVRMLVVLDRASTDATHARLKEAAQTEPRLRLVWAPENRCVVDAYVRGYQEAVALGFEWILEIDAGYSHQPNEIVRFVEQIDTGDWDCVFGSRFCAGGVITQSPFRRRALSWAGTQLTNSLLGTRLHDMTSGFQLFHRDVLIRLLAIGIVSQGHFFQTEIKFRCRDLATCEVPITYRAASPSVRIASIRDALTVLWLLRRERTSGLGTANAATL